MKKFLICVLSLMLALCFCFAGCAEVIEGTSTGGGNINSSGGTSSSGDSSDSEIAADAYTVSLVLPDGVTTMPDLTGIQVYWINSTSVYSADFNSSGFAYYNGLDGEYTVTLSQQLDNYYYNPNIYTADGTAEGRNVQIQLEKFQTWTSGEGNSAGNKAKATQAGAYRVEFTEPGQVFYFQFSPTLVTTSYQFNFQTCASVTENDICPSLSAINDYSYTTRSIDTTISANSGSYTKNIELVIDMYSQTSNLTIYCLSIVSQDEDYSSSKYLDIYFSQEKELTDDDYWESVGGLYTAVELEDYTTTWQLPDGTFTWVSDLYTDFSAVDTGRHSDAATAAGLRRDSDNGYYYDSDGFYYIYHNGAFYMLFFELSTCHYDIGYSFTTNARCGNAVDGPLNYANVIKAYDNTAQYESAVGGNIHPVTKQIITFLYDYSRLNLFYDGSSDGSESGNSYGTLEQLGYSSDDNNQWLFACGFYM